MMLCLDEQNDYRSRLVTDRLYRCSNSAKVDPLKKTLSNHKSASGGLHAPVSVAVFETLL